MSEARNRDKRDIESIVESRRKMTWLIESILDRHMGEDEGQWHTVGSELWECSKSPVGLCVYHKVNDRMHDSCIFCGEPEERK